MIASHKLGKKLPSSSKIVISHADRSDVFCNQQEDPRQHTKQPVYKQQLNTECPEIVHTRGFDEMYPDSFIGLGKFQGRTYHIKVDPHVPQKKTPCRPVPIHQKPPFKKTTSRNATCRHSTSSEQCHIMDQQLCDC